MKYRKLNRLTVWPLFVCATVVAGLSGSANAALVATGDAVESRDAAQARQQLRSLAERPELAEKMKSLGLPPDQALSRVDAMTDAEVISLSNRLGELPAGAARSNDIIIILLLIIILVILI